MILDDRERLIALEIKFAEFKDESKNDRAKLRELVERDHANIQARLDQVNKEISEQIREQTARTTLIEALKWGVGMILAAVIGYFVNLFPIRH